MSTTEGFLTATVSLPVECMKAERVLEGSKDSVVHKIQRNPISNTGHDQQLQSLGRSKDHEKRTTLMTEGGHEAWSLL